jgi:hypothetical protein
VIDPPGVERRRSPFDAMDRVALLQQHFGQKCAVLAGYASDKGDPGAAVSTVALGHVPKLLYPSKKVFTGMSFSSQAMHNGEEQAVNDGKEYNNVTNPSVTAIGWRPRAHASMQSLRWAGFAGIGRRLHRRKRRK